MATTRQGWEKTRARLTTLKVRRIDLVPAGASPGAHVVLAKRQFSPAQREGMAARGTALPSGGFPIATAADLRNAISAYGRASNPAQAKAHIIDRARTLGLISALPADWNVRKEDAAMPEPENTPTLAEQIAALSDDEQAGVTAYVDGLVAELEAERGRLAEVLATVGGGGAEEEDPDEVLKGLPDEVVERIKKAESEAAEAKAQAAELTKAERSRVFKARAASLVKISGGDDGADKLGAVLEQAEALMDADAYAELERVLTAADTQLDKADSLFGSLGSDEGASGEFVSTVKARAAELEKEGLDPIEALRAARRENADEADAYASRVRSGSSD